MLTASLLLLFIFTLAYTMVARRLSSTAVTALFALLVVGQSVHQYSETILVIAINTVWISALLHGVSAAPGARWYAAKIVAKGACPEIIPVEVSAKPIVTR